MNLNDHLRDQLQALARKAGELSGALACAGELPPLPLAAAVVEVDKLADRLAKLSTKALAVATPREPDQADASVVPLSRAGGG
jgi:hypothetical protein